jgi:hypothetical protein
MEDLKTKLKTIENQKFLERKDYTFVYNTLSSIQHKLVELYEDENPINKHVFVLANLNLFLYVVENVKRELVNQCQIRCHIAPEIVHDFYFAAHFKQTRELYESYLHVHAFLDIPARIRQIIRVQDDVIADVEKIFANFLVEFYRQPVTLEMATKGAKLIMNTKDFWYSTVGAGNPLMLTWLKEVEEHYLSYVALKKTQNL